MTREEMLKAMKEMCNGLQLAEGREKGETELLTGQNVTIEDYSPLSDGDKAYYAFTVKEFPSTFFFSGSQLSALIDRFGDGVRGLVIRHEEKVQTKNKRTFTPITVVDYE